MKFFKSMALAEAREFARKLENEKRRLYEIGDKNGGDFLKAALADIYFFTDNLTKDY